MSQMSFEIQLGNFQKIIFLIMLLKFDLLVLFLKRKLVTPLLFPVTIILIKFDNLIFPSIYGFQKIII